MMLKKSPWLSPDRTSIYIQLSAVILLFVCLVLDVSAQRVPDKNYLRIEQSKSEETDDLKITDDLEITSIGALSFKKNMLGHADLTKLESDINGKALVLEFGGGYVFNWDISLFLGFGISLGYNSDKDDFIAAYFPEVGIVVDLTKTTGVTVSAKRYHNLYEQDEAIVMLGLVFRK